MHNGFWTGNTPRTHVTGCHPSLPSFLISHQFSMSNFPKESFNSTRATPTPHLLEELILMHRLLMLLIESVISRFQRKEAIRRWSPTREITGTKRRGSYCSYSVTDIRRNILVNTGLVPRTISLIMHHREVNFINRA